MLDLHDVANSGQVLIAYTWKSLEAAEKKVSPGITTFRLIVPL